MFYIVSSLFFFFSSRRRHTRCALVTGVQTCALPISLYENGIKANMEQMAEYGVNAAISPAAMEAYIQAHPFEINKAFELINTQYWVASFLNGPELFANFLRSGYPTLDPNPYPASETPGGFIRRMPYPDSETIVNQQNVNDAITRQGGNELSTRMWWDKE